MGKSLLFLQYACILVILVGRLPHLKKKQGFKLKTELEVRAVRVEALDCLFMVAQASSFNSEVKMGLSSDHKTCL